MKIEELYEEIKTLDRTDKCTISEAVCKFFEESGEMVQEINKTTGRKIIRETNDEILSNIKEEIADTLQNLLLISSRFDIDINDLLELTSSKNQKWKSQISARQSQKKIEFNS